MPVKQSTVGFRRTNNLILRLIAGIYLLAFASLGVQILGLSGSGGIAPAAGWLEVFSRELPVPQRFWAHPTVFWLHAGDGALAAACAAGILAAAAAAAGFFPLFAFGLCFLLYLSFYTVAIPFLHFQWDLLLLETGFLAVLAAPVRNYKEACEPSRASRFLFRFLFFKLIFVSGLCKLASFDPAWRSFTALTFHYETQPLPPWTAWHFHHLPLPFHRLSQVFVFAAELVLPFFICFGRRMRLAAFWGNVLLQALIALSGNYGFFNLLTIVLALSLLDDEWLRLPKIHSGGAPSVARRVAAIAACALLVPASIYLSAVRWTDKAPRSAWMDRWVVMPLQAWPMTGTYGLFSVMTTERREIILEGSEDGETWKAYEFLWKPGDLSRRPGFTTPHMPRLDWQMWFAALGSWKQNPWFVQFCRRVLEGRPEVLRLLASNPFPAAPPRYLRAVFYEYRFSDSGDLKRKIWWTRRPLGLYAPVMTLDRRGE